MYCKRAITELMRLIERMKNNKINVIQLLKGGKSNFRIIKGLINLKIEI
jgi:hypothetical protein